MPSTYLFHRVGFISMSAVAIADSSRCSINKFETLSDNKEGNWFQRGIREDQEGGGIHHQPQQGLKWSL